MKSPFNNLSTALTFAVPTAAAILGLLWLLLRKKDDGDDDDDKPTRNKATVGNSRVAGETFGASVQLGTSLKIQPTGNNVDAGSGDVLAKQNSGSARLRGQNKGTVQGDSRASGDVPVPVAESVITTQLSSVSSAAPPSKYQSTIPVASPELRKESAEAGQSGRDVRANSSEKQLKDDDAAVVQAKACLLTSAQPGSSLPGSSAVQPPAPDSSQEVMVAKQIVEGVFAKVAHDQALAQSRNSTEASNLPTVKSESKESNTSEQKGEVEGQNTLVNSKSFKESSSSSAVKADSASQSKSDSNNDNNSSSGLRSQHSVDRNTPDKKSNEAENLKSNSNAGGDSPSSRNSRSTPKVPPPKPTKPSSSSALSKDSRNSSSPSSRTRSPHDHKKQGSKQSPPKSSEKPNKQQPSKSDPQKVSGDAEGGRRRTRSGASDGASEAQDDASHSSSVSENGQPPSSGSPICDTNSEASNDSGRGGSVGESLIPLQAGELVRYEFNFPSDLCGRLIGKGGKNIQQIKQHSGATVTLSSNPFTPEYQICQVTGVQSEVDYALSLIRKKFPQHQYPRLDMTSLLPPPPAAAPVVLPELLQLSLPDGVSMGIVVSAVVNAGHIFVQQPTHPTFPSLERLQQFMYTCYGDQNAPALPRPVEGGIICAAESDGAWFRAQIVQVYPDTDECDIKYVDYGGYARVPITTLKQIRSDFMTLPFQAIECYLANITPLQDEEYFSDKAMEVVMELTAGKMLQGQVICRGEDSICYVHLYQVTGSGAMLLNREMVNREVVRWIEIL